MALLYRLSFYLNITTTIFNILLWPYTQWLLLLYYDLTLTDPGFIRIHQTHYEQFGDTTGDVHVQGRPPYSLNVRGIRDHSYGRGLSVVSDSYLLKYLNTLIVWWGLLLYQFFN